MTATEKHPWASGPGEILRHGLALLAEDSDTNRRLAMISIDNAVELMIKTYLGLPKRITGLAFTRKEFQEVAESFTSLLDALEKHASDKLDGLDLGTIEWYHRLRNQLYHQGNGLTVERNKVELYAEVANLLFKNLFGVLLVEHLRPKADLLGEFIEGWTALERGLVGRVSRDNALKDAVSRGTINSAAAVADFLSGTGALAPSEVNEIDALRRIRNEVLHGNSDPRQLVTPDVVARTKRMAARFTL